MKMIFVAWASCPGRPDHGQDARATTESIRAMLESIRYNSP